MSHVTAGRPPGHIRGSSALVPLVLFLAIVAGAAVWLQQREAGTDVPTSVRVDVGAVPPTPASPAIETRYGMRVKQVARIAGGGLLDLRYTVLDEDVLETLIHSGLVGMRLEVERNGVVLDTQAMRLHDHHFVRGSTYYTLFRNTRGIVRRGDTLTVHVGELELAHVPVL